MIFAFVVSVSVGLNAGNLSDDEFNELKNDCLGNENKDSCQRLVDSGQLISVKQCGDKNTCAGIGFVYDLTKNYQQSFQYFNKACKLNDEIACFNVGLSYTEGQGIRQDYAKAKTYFEKGCNLNGASACFNLGHFYFDGRGVRQNKSMAKEYFGKACDLGNQDGCHNYKILNEQGIQ